MTGVATSFKALSGRKGGDIKSGKARGKSYYFLPSCIDVALSVRTQASNCSTACPALELKVNVGFAAFIQSVMVMSNAGMLTSLITSLFSEEGGGSSKRVASAATANPQLGTCIVTVGL